MKDAYYFSHDSNARNDPKVIRLRRLAGLEGYGLFWCVVEMLRDAPEYKLPTEMIDDVIYEFRAKRETFDALVDCGLVSIDDKMFWSESLLRRMRKFEQTREQRRDAGRASAKSRLNEKQTDAERVLNEKQTDTERTLNVKVKESKEKESKEKETKNKSTEKSADGYSEDFLNFWQTYPRREGKSTAWKAWKARVKAGAEPIQIIEAAKRYAAKCKFAETEIKFTKLPGTFLNPDWSDWLDYEPPKPPEEEYTEETLAIIAQLKANPLPPSKTHEEIFGHNYPPIGKTVEECMAKLRARLPEGEAHDDDF